MQSEINKVDRAEDEWRLHSFTRQPNLTIDMNMKFGSTTTRLPNLTIDKNMKFGSTSNYCYQSTRETRKIF